MSYKNTNNSQKGISLVVAFLIMTIILAVVLSVSTILFSEINIIRNIGDAVSAFYASETGTEKTLYIDRKQIPTGGARGLCNICNACDANDCTNCTTSSLATGGSNGCNPLACNNCQVTYTSTFDGAGTGARQYSIFATVTPDLSDPTILIFNLKSKGFYKDTTRAIELNVIGQ